MLPLVSVGVPTVEPTAIVPTTPLVDAPAPHRVVCSVSDRFPESIRQWCEIITRYSNSVDVDLIAAVMLQESGGDPHAVSRSGAVGLLQVMPRDAPGFGSTFASRPSTAELLDPDFNVQYGTRMLAGLIDKYGVRDGLRHYGGLGYGWTYADKVLAHYERYKK